MTTMVQSMIEDANRRVKASNSRIFGKKATDQQVHNNLHKTVETYIIAWHVSPGSNNTKAAFIEMTQAAALSRRNLKP